MLKAMKYYISNHYESGTLLHREGCNLIPKSLDNGTFIGALPYSAAGNDRSFTASPRSWPMSGMPETTQ